MSPCWFVATVSVGNPDLYIFDVERRTDRRLTFENGSDTLAVWSPDGRHIVYQCENAICARRADGTGSRVEMVPAPAGAPTVSSDGKYLAFVREQARTATDLFVVPIGPGGLDAPPVEAPRPIVVAERLQNSVDISPDGTLAAYDSNETGVSEVYLTTFPARQGKWQVSRNGGIRPLWSRSGDRIFYANSDGLVEVPIERNPNTDVRHAARSSQALCSARASTPLVSIGPSTAHASSSFVRRRAWPRRGRSSSWSSGSRNTRTAEWRHGGPARSSAISPPAPPARLQELSPRTSIDNS